MAPPQVNRAVLGKLRGCQSDYGGICMNTCGNRPNCKIKKTPFLVQARSHKVEPNHRKITINGYHITQFEIRNEHTEEFINELTGAEIGRKAKNG